MAALCKMHDPKLALVEKLTSQGGTNSIGKQAQGHADTRGCHATNDSLAESIFGTFDYYNLRRFEGISQEVASGFAQAVHSKVLSSGDRVTHRKAEKKAEAAKQPPHFGWFHTLPAREQEVLVQVARLTVNEMRQSDREDHAQLLQYHKARRKANEEDELDSLFTRYLCIGFNSASLTNGRHEV